MKVRDIMARDAATAPSDASLALVARTMWERDCGFLPVVDGAGRLCGVVTDRDACMASWTQGRPLAEIPVFEAMSRGVVAVGEDDPVAHVHGELRARQVRRLPVVDAEQRVVGVVSLADLARHALASRGEHERIEVARTLGEVCAARPEPRGPAPERRRHAPVTAHGGARS